MSNWQRSTWVEIDLKALAGNVRRIKALLPENVLMTAVVKADAYGCGAIPAARTALANGADRLAVAVLSEAIELREAGFTAPILILGFTEDSAAVVRYDLTQTIYNWEMAESLNAAAQKQGKRVKVHVKLDTGMGRIGVQPKEAVQFIEQLADLPFLTVEGMFTHFAVADEKDKTYTAEQFALYSKVRTALQQKGICPPCCHAANSAAVMELPDTYLDMVRPGVILYGMYPSEEVDKKRLALEPVLSWKARIVHIKEVEDGTSISYGRKYRAVGRRRIATLTLGYADGYSRLYFGKGEFLVHGVRVPLAGRVCMDQCMIDVTSVPEAEIGDEAVIIGSQGEERITIEELADKLGTINYEVSCMIRRRVPRIYK